MQKTIADRRAFRAWQIEHERATPNVGEMAPDFELHDANGQNPVKLSSFRGKKPVALIFGSYTWPPYVTGTVRLSDLYKTYQDRIQFLTIYIREAHPVDGWWFGKGLPKLLFRLQRSKAAFDVYDPKTMEERRKVAGECETALQYGIHTYVDEMDDAVSRAYAAAPTRLYLIGKDGRVAYKGGLGPFGFHPSELDKAIKNYLKSSVE